MNLPIKLASMLALSLGATQAVSAQATITGPATWVAGQPTTVTWTGTASPVCAGGVRVTLNLGTTKIQTGTAVPLSAGRASIPGATLSAGTAVSFTLTDQCTGKVLTAAHPVTITGSTATVVPVTSSATTTITPQIRQNIDSACQGVLGSACSTSASYNSVYSAISQQIIQGTLKSDSSSIMYSYLIPMVGSSATWKANIVDNAWRGAGCTSTAPESQWTPKVAQLQTYQAVVNAMKQQGCTAAAGNVSSGAPASTQYLTAQQIAPGYSQVWGAAASSATLMTNCPPATGAVTCARSDLAAYVRVHGTAILQTIESPAYASVTGQSLDSTHAQTLNAAYGRNWTGADDLKPFVQGNPNLFPVSAVFSKLDSQGCPVNAVGAKLSPNETCGLYYLDSNGAHAPGSYPAYLGKAMVILTAANPGGGLLVSNNGTPLKVVVTPTGWAIGAGIVAQGGGNIVAQGGGNIVAQGGGNIVAQGGGNIVAQGGGNIVAQGGGNIAFADALTAARSAGLVAPGGVSVISNDGGSFLPSIGLIPAIASLIGENSSGLLSKTSLLTDNGAALTRTSLSLNAAVAAVIISPSTWTYGQPAMIKWTPSAGAPACSLGYRVLINGSTPAGNPVALTLGMSLLAAGSVPRGTVSVALRNECTQAPATAPFTVKIQ